MSSVRFRWLPRIGNRIWSTLRSVRPQRSFRRPEQQAQDEKDRVGVHSEPHIAHLTRRQTTTAQPLPPRHQHHSSVREKGKRRSRQEIMRNKSTNDITSKPGKAFEPWAMWNNGSTPGPSKSKSTETGLQVPTQSSRVASPLPSPVGSSQVTTPVSEYPPSQTPDGERPRSVVMKWMSNLKLSNRQSSYASSYSPMMEASTSSFAHGRPHPVFATAPPSRDSGDAISGYITSRQSSMSGKLTKAMRAASWTAPDFALARPSEDMTSIYSGDRAEELDEETLLWGAGGVAGSPVPSAPNSALLSTVSSAQSIGPSAAAVRAILSRTEGAADVHAQEASQQDPISQPRHSPCQARLRTTSPLAQVSYHPEETIDGSGSDSDDDSGVSYDSADDSSSIHQPPPRSLDVIPNEDVDLGASRRSGPSFDLQPSTSQMYQDEDEESEDEDEVHLEVRTRRPSQGATEMSPPRRSLSAHRPQEGKQRPMICT